MKLFQIGLALVMMAGTAAVQADSVKNQNDEPVVSQYEFSSVSYGSNQDGNTYSRVVTMHNGVKNSDITTVNGVVSNVLWDKNSQGQTAPGYIQGVGLKDGNVTANAVAVKNIQASSATIGMMYGNHLTVPAAALGNVVFSGNGSVSGVQTNGSDPTCRQRTISAGLFGCQPKQYEYAKFVSEDRIRLTNESSTAGSRK